MSTGTLIWRHIFENCMATCQMLTIDIFVWFYKFAGLIAAMTVVNRHNEKANGSEFILMTDGDETAPPYIKDVSAQVSFIILILFDIQITLLIMYQH